MNITSSRRNVQLTDYLNCMYSPTITVYFMSLKLLQYIKSVTVVFKNNILIYNYLFTNFNVFIYLLVIINTNFVVFFCASNIYILYFAQFVSSV